MYPTKKEKETSEKRATESEYGSKKERNESREEEKKEFGMSKEEELWPCFNLGLDLELSSFSKVSCEQQGFHSKRNIYSPTADVYDTPCCSDCDGDLSTWIQSPEDEEKTWSVENQQFYNHFLSVDHQLEKTWICGLVGDIYDSSQDLTSFEPEMEKKGDSGSGHLDTLQSMYTLRPRKNAKKLTELKSKESEFERRLYRLNAAEILGSTVSNKRSKKLRKIQSDQKRNDLNRKRAAGIPFSREERKLVYAKWKDKQAVQRQAQLNRRLSGQTEKHSNYPDRRKIAVVRPRGERGRFLKAKTPIPPDLRIVF